MTVLRFKLAFIIISNVYTLFGLIFAGLIFAKLIFAGLIFAILEKIAKNSPAKMFKYEAIAKISPAKNSFFKMFIFRFLHQIWHFSRQTKFML